MRAEGPMTRRERRELGEDRKGYGPRTAVVKRASMIDEARQRGDETGRVLMMYQGAGWGAGGGGQRPEQLAHEFAREACVLHLHGSNPNRIQRPVTDVVVASTGRNTDWIEGLDAADATKVLYLGFPEKHAWEILGELPPDWCVWYDCMDDWEAFGSATWWNEQRERQIVERADLVTATAHSLTDKCRTWGAEPHFIPNSTRLLDQPVPADVEPDVDLIFVGCMTDGWIDWELIRRCVWEGLSVRLIGDPPSEGKPVDGVDLDWAGRVPNDELREVLATGRVGIIPFLDVPLVHAVWPIKYADYLTAGIPTVAACLPELEGAEFCAVTWDRDSFIEACFDCLDSPPDSAGVMQEAEQHTAARRMALIRELLAEVAGW
jgi:hypothetical protein